ncbi:hypothetical protein GWG65_20090 [Bradyrhizobium sp. CSA207]|nr:hypothetical protein [Bradyrhizobium sp. CSA207]MDE5443705.1 hypothetical protein [Bradyrhizobium sp. CSA207]
MRQSQTESRPISLPGITTHAAHPEEVRALIALLAGAEQSELRRRVGFAG